MIACLRPLSALLLPPTWPEREGIVDRDKLYDFSGRSRKGLIDLAHKLGLKDIPAPTTGCALTEPHFGRKVFDLFEHNRENDVWSFHLLKYGRHFRFDAETKIIVGRNESDNESLRYMHQASHETPSTLISPEGFHGPCALVVGSGSEAAILTAGALMLRYANGCEQTSQSAEVDDGKSTRHAKIHTNRDVDQLETIATIK